MLTIKNRIGRTLLVMLPVLATSPLLANVPVNFQGRLTENGAPVNQTVHAVAVTITDGNLFIEKTVSNVAVVNGLFQIDVNFENMPSGLDLNLANVVIEFQFDDGDDFIQVGGFPLNRGLVSHQANSLGANATAKGTFDLSGNPITNIGTTGSQFTSTGGLDLKAEMRVKDESDNNKVVYNPYADEENEVVATYTATGQETVMKIVSQGAGKAIQCDGQSEFNGTTTYKDGNGNVKCFVNPFAFNNNESICNVTSLNDEIALRINVSGSGKAFECNGNSEFNGFTKCNANIECSGTYTAFDPNMGLGQTTISPGNISCLNMGGVAQLVCAGLTGSTNISNGDVTCNTVMAGMKFFRIDHPLDPDNKYLMHTSIESSEMINLYSGNVTTDAEGFATVEMPDWFEALNTDFRYQLTVVGTFAQAIVAKKIDGGQFVIRTNEPTVEVSWQVTGVRHDRFARENPLVVESEKTEPRP